MSQSPQVQPPSPTSPRGSFPRSWGGAWGRHPGSRPQGVVPVQPPIVQVGRREKDEPAKVAQVLLVS